MKSKFILIVLIAFTLASYTCEKPKRVAISIANIDTASVDVNRFFNEFPDSVAVDGKKAPVGPYHMVYAVMFRKAQNELGDYYPELDFSEITKLYPDSSNGIRIYQAIRTDMEGDHKVTKLINYLTFTKSSTTDDFPDDDILDNVYLINNHKFDLRGFRVVRGAKIADHGITHHLSCAPQCPRGSLIKR